MKRSLWKESLSDGYCPPWPCPACGVGAVAFVPQSLVKEETAESKKAHGHDAWDPDWIEYVFTAWAECGRCKQRLAISGNGGVRLFQTAAEGEADWFDLVWPKICRPMPEIITIPDKCPSEVKEELLAAFSLFWSQPAACAGRVRVALECLMDQLGVGKGKEGGEAKHPELSLHARIDEFAKTDPAIGPQLMALKWLGNAGSHSNRTVSVDDLLDAFEIMEHALAEIIDKRSAKVAELAKKLTEKHGR